MRRLTFTIVGVVLAAAIILPWMAAFRSDQAVSYHYGRIGGRQVQCVAVDGTHFDRYFCLVFDSSARARVNYNHGRIVLDGRQVQFPSGHNAGFLRPDGQIRFVTVTERDIAPDSSGSSEVYYIFGRIPKQKDFTFGVPRYEFVEQRLRN